MDTLETHVVETLTREADSVHVPSCPVDDLLARGERAARRRTRGGWTVGLVAAAVIVGLVAAFGIAGVGRDGSAPPANQPTPTSTTSTRPNPPLTLADLPPGAPPQVPWWHAGVLHVGTNTIRMRQPRMVTGGGSTLVVRNAGLATAQVFLVSGDRLVRLDGLEPVVAVSPDGHYAVGEIEAGNQIGFALWDLRTVRQIGQLVTRFQHSICCGGGDIIDTMGVDDTGMAILGEGNGWAWFRGTHRLVTIRLASETAIVGAAPVGVTVSPPQDAAKYAAHPATWIESVASDGSLTRTGRVPSISATWSPNGQSLGALASGAGVPFLYDPQTGARLRLDIPVDVQSDGPVVWESTQSVLVPTQDVRTPRSGALLRCSTSTGHCALVMRTEAGGVDLPQ